MKKKTNIPAVIREVKALVKKYGLADVRAGFNRYILAVRTVTKLRKNVEQAETDLKKALGKIKI